MTEPDDEHLFSGSSADALSATQASSKRDRPVRPSAVRFVLGWFVAPTLVIAGLILAGVHLGARNADAWYTSLVRWLLSLE